MPGTGKPLRAYPWHPTVDLYGVLSNVMGAKIYLCSARLTL